MGPECIRKVEAVAINAGLTRPVLTLLFGLPQIINRNQSDFADQPNGENEEDETQNPAKKES